MPRQLNQCRKSRWRRRRRRRRPSSLCGGGRGTKTREKEEEEEGKWSWRNDDDRKRGGGRWRRRGKRDDGELKLVIASAGKKGEREATPSVGLGREEDPSFEMRMYLSLY